VSLAMLDCNIGWCLLVIINDNRNKKNSDEVDEDLYSPDDDDEDNNGHVQIQLYGKSFRLQLFHYQKRLLFFH
jgi:hypothetical protein